MNETTAPEVSMTSAERDQLIRHLVKLRDGMASVHPRIAAWANARTCELVDERDRQDDYLKWLSRDL